MIIVFAFSAYKVIILSQSMKQKFYKYIDFCRIAKKYKTMFIILCLFFSFLGTIWIWHYSNNEDAELKLYALQAIAEIIVAIFETIATFLMIKSIKQNGDANREMKKMNEKLQCSMQAQTNVLRQQQEFYAVQLEEKRAEMRKAEKAKILNRYLSYVKNFLFAYNRGENFDGINTHKLFMTKKKEHNISEKQQEICMGPDDYKDDKISMLMAILKVRLTPDTDLESYIFKRNFDAKNSNKESEKIVLTGSDKDVKEKFDCLLREYKYKLRTKLPTILSGYFSNFEENEELQEICG